MAVFTLPPEMIPFYKKNIEYITEHAVDPDKRRYAVEVEASRHYIDIDHYVDSGGDPFSVVPQKWNDATTKYSEDTLREYGILPWHIYISFIQLTKAFEENNLEKIVRISSDIGHYIGDAHVPLHTTENYNGQLTNQRGIHGFWESRLPELKAHEYNYFVGRAQYIDFILEDAWITIKESFSAKDSVLDLERKLNQNFPSDKKFVYQNRGAFISKTYASEYADKYHNMLQGMVERRLTQSIIKVGSYWYTAWVRAGQPNLSKLMEQKISPKQLEKNRQLNKSYQEKKIKGREH